MLGQSLVKSCRVGAEADNEPAVRPRTRTCLIGVFCCLVLATGGSRSAWGADEEDYYRLVTIASSKASTDSRSKRWKPAPRGVPLEISGLVPLEGDALAVAIRKGEVWILNNVYDIPAADVTYHRFASGLHEPLGLLKKGDAFYTAQRSELTKLRDVDGDQVADEYLTIANDWGVTGNYHEYAYGPKMDGDGNLWLTLNIGLGRKEHQSNRLVHEPKLGYTQGRWRGWGMKINSKGELVPMCAGMRSPCGLGANRAGDMFYADQQGDWVGACSLHHMREGAFFHHPEALASMNERGSPLQIQSITSVPNGLSYPQAVEQFAELQSPAVWLPYKKAGQSASDIMLDDSRGRFGPFDGQLFIGEFTLASVQRVYLEQVKGQYQGACFPFRRGFASAVLRLAQGHDGSVFAGLTNRGWSSLGTASYGLQRLVWTGKMPFEIKEMKATCDGFELVFTKPVDPVTAGNPNSYAFTSYTYNYHATYGSDEILKRKLTATAARVSSGGLRVNLEVPGRRELFVHELIAGGVRSRDGEPLLHADAYYTLNQIPD